MLYTALTKKALKISFDAHKNQVDKSGMPYVYHPFHLAEQMNDELSTCVALLHDVAEDSDITLDDLKRQGFSENVLAAVDAMTHREGETYMDFIKRLSVNEIARHVKIQDIRNNMDLSRIPSPTDADFARIEKYKKAYAILTEGLVRSDGTSDVLTEREILHAASQFRLNDDSGIISGKESGYDHSLTPEESKERIRRMKEEILKRLEELGYGTADKK